MEMLSNWVVWAMAGGVALAGIWFFGWFHRPSRVLRYGESGRIARLGYVAEITIRQENPDVGVLSPRASFFITGRRSRPLDTPQEEELEGDQGVLFPPDEEGWEEYRYFPYALHWRKEGEDIRFSWKVRTV